MPRVMSGVLVDTSVWVHHFRRGEAGLANLLASDGVLVHPLVMLELACGTPPAPRSQTLAHLRQLRQAASATQDEVLELIERKRLYDTGCGAVDICLLASTLLTPGARLWTRDRQLQVLAARFGVDYAGLPG